MNASETLYIPALLTCGMFVLMLMPRRRTTDWDFGVIFRAVWLLPICLTWANR